MVSHCWISSDSDDSLPPVPHFIKGVSNSKTHVQFPDGDKIVSRSNDEVETSSEKKIVNSSGAVVCSKSVCSKLSEKNKSKRTQKSNLLLKTSLSPEQIVKDIRCSISSMVQKLFSGDKSSFLEGFTDSTSIYHIVDLSTPVIKWKYEPKVQNAEILIPNQIVIAIEAKDLHKFLESTIGVSQFASWVHSCIGNCSLLYVVCIGLNGFKYMLQKKEKQKVDVSSGKQFVNLREKLDEFLAILQISFGINVIHIENKSEFTLLLSQLTQAITQAPLKKRRKEHIKFINQNASVKIDSSSGKGATCAWKQMLQQMFNVSADVASAITSQYDTPRKLIDAYQTLPEASAALLLADLQVRRGVGSLQTERRLGPELSKRIFKLFTSQDGTEVL